MNTEKLMAHLTFELDKELFAINVEKVISILEMSHITKIPNAPSYLKGVINLRGKVLPVVSGRIKMGMPPKEPDRQTSIIVLSIWLDDKEVNVGLMVDSVHSVIEILPESVLPSPSIGDKFKTDFIIGIFNYSNAAIEKSKTDEDFLTGNITITKASKEDENRLIMILDIDKIFSTTEIISLSQHNETSEKIDL